MSQKARIALTVAIVLAAPLVGCGTGPKQGLERGKLVFDTCAPCHGKDGSGNRALGAPAIAGLPDWYVTEQLKKFKTDMRGAHPDDMEGHRMRPMARTLHRAGDLESVVQYVATLPPVAFAAEMGGGDKTAGEALFTGICVTCHNADAKGNKDLGAPTLVGQHDWYLYTQLQKFHSGMRGTHPDDVYGGQMRAMSMTLADTTAMRDVVAYIKSLSH